MRPIWKGQISFGLINIPIELYSAEKRTEIQFKLLDSRNKAKIRYERINEETGEEVPWSDIVKAYEFKKKNYVILEDDDFKQAAPENNQTFEIEDFVPKQNIECIYFEKPYYLVPSKHAEKGYVLLREILTKTQKVAIGKVIIRTKQYLAALLPQSEALILNTLRFVAEIRSLESLSIPKDGIKDYKISDKEVAMAEKLVESMAIEWDPNKYHDTYRESLMNWIAKKAKQGHIPLPAELKEEKQGAEVIDFMDLLKKSLQKKTSRTAPRKHASQATAKTKKLTKTKKQRKHH